MTKLRVIVSGLIAQYPIGGVTWDYVQYLLGLVAEGHDVYYLEDSEQWPYDPRERGSGTDARYNADYLARAMARFGMGERWAYRLPEHTLPGGVQRPEVWYGLSPERRREVIETADLLINVSSGIGNPGRYRDIPALVYVDTDPVFTQIRVVQDPQLRAHVDAHDALFSYGECRSDLVPDTGHTWRPMRKPIAVSEWDPSRPHRDVFTTVMNWTSYSDVRWQGCSYGQKDEEFSKFLDLPSRVAPSVLELAAGTGRTRRLPAEQLEARGWRLVDPARVCPAVESYRRYIESSLAEWSVAKQGYVLGQSGWFSGRTACYLAAGRPVVVQDTGFAGVLPCGDGLLRFRDVEEAAEAIREVELDWQRHARAAREIAEEYFDARKLVRRLIGWNPQTR